MVLSGSAVDWFRFFVRDVFTFSAVPYFFLASGFFLAGHLDEEPENWWLYAIKKRAFTLFVPYVCWVVLGFAFKGLGVGVWDFSLCHVCHAVGFTASPPEPTALWFLRALMLMILFSSLIAFAFCRRGLKWLVGALFLGDLALHLAGRFLWFDHLISLAGVGYFALGMQLRLGLFRAGECDQRRLAWMAIVLLSVFVLARVLWGGANGSVEAFCRWMFVPLALMLIWFVVPDRPLPKWISQNAFPVYLIHPFVYFLLFTLERKGGYEGLSGSNLLVHLAFFAVSFSASFAFAMLLRRLPFGLGRMLFGGR